MQEPFETKKSIFAIFFAKAYEKSHEKKTQTVCWTSYTCHGGAHGGCYGGGYGGGHGWWQFIVEAMRVVMVVVSQMDFISVVGILVVTGCRW